MDEFLTVFLEGRNGVECKFVILGNLGFRARDGHWGESFVCLEKILCERVGDGDKVSFKVVRVPNQEGRGNDGGEGLIREIAAVEKDALALTKRGGLARERAYVCRR